MRTISITVISWLMIGMAAIPVGAVDVDSPYGVVYGIWATDFSSTRWNAVCDAGITWVRCGVFSWGSVEKVKDTFSWTDTDRAVSAANARGLHIYADLGGTPGWASSTGSSTGPPTNPQDWYDYVFACVSRYKNSVKYWNFWNEPNLYEFWTGTRSRYINDILIVGSNAAHAADPDCMVLAPELSSSPEGDPNTWMRECLQQAGDKIDIISYHQYDGGGTPSGRLAAFDSLHNYITSLGYGNKPIWITECGWRSDLIGLQGQADNLVGMLKGMHARSSWWQKFFWFKHWDAHYFEQWGLLDDYDLPKLSWYAYRDHIVANPAPQMVSINLSTTDIVDDLTRVAVGNGDTVAATQASRRCRKNADPNSDNYMYFAVNDGFAYQCNRPQVTITADYYDGGSGSITLEYDSVSGPYTTAGTVNLAGVNTWKQAQWKFPDAYFGNRQEGGADFRIYGGVGNTFYLDIVTVTDTPCPPNQATNPNPQPQTTGVDINDDLSWSAGFGTESHDIYFGKTNPPTFKQNQTELATTYDPGTLNYSTTYYWQINEVNAAGTTTGIIWNFTTIKFNGDFDGDGDADQEDFGHLQFCFSGTGSAFVPGCEDANLDNDNDVDNGDFLLFLNCMKGVNNPPGC